MLSEMDGSEMTQAGSLPEEKQHRLSCASALSSFGTGEHSCTYVPLLYLKSQCDPALLFAT